jgi:hypothetical protein
MYANELPPPLVGDASTTSRSRLIAWRSEFFHGLARLGRRRKTSDLIGHVASAQHEFRETSWAFSRRPVTVLS